MENPFRFGGELSCADLVNREEELAEILSTVRNGEKLFLIGPRRYGKTSLLNAAIEQGEAEGIILLSFNAEAFPTLADLMRRIFAETTRRLISPTRKAGQEVKRIFTRLKPEINLDLAEQTISASLGLEPEQPADTLPLLVDVLDGVEQLARKISAPVGLMLDEFQQVIALGGESAEGQLRAAVQRHRKVGYVFAGSDTRMLAEMTTDRSRPFYRLGARRFLTSLPDQQVRDWLIARFAAGGFRLSAEAADYLIEMAERVPYDIQLLAHTCWNLLLGQKKRTLNPELIAAAGDTLIAQNDPLFNSIWSQLSPNQKKALLAVINEEGKMMTSQQALRRYRLAAATMQKSLAALREKGVIRSEETFQASRWRFEDPLFKRWLAAQARKAGMIPPRV
jgi:hypothetical protein